MRRDGFGMSEADIHAASVDLVEVFKRPGLIYWHTPNGGKRHIRAAVKFKRQGVRKGVPDLTFIIPRTEDSNGFALPAFLEVKTTKGRMSPAQKEFRENCISMGVRPEGVPN